MKAILLALLILFASTVHGQEERHWLIPDHYPLQYAGNIGFLSTGLGYDACRNKLELDFMYGFVPADFGGPLHSVTVKPTWIPFEPVDLGSDFALDFLTTGLVLNYSLGDQFFFIASTQEKYPARYYDYSSALRFGIFLGGRLHWNTGSDGVSRAAFYYEIGTYDLALHNYVFNVGKSSFRGLFNLALGVKFYLDPLLVD